MRPKSVDGMANSVDPDQTAQEQFELGLLCLPKIIRASSRENLSSGFATR